MRTGIQFVRIDEGKFMAERKLPDDFHARYDDGERAARGVARESARRQRDNERVEDDRAGLRVDYDESTELPNRIAVLTPVEQEASRSMVRRGRRCWIL